MSTYGQGGSRLWRRIRQEVLDRDHHECQYRFPGCLFIATQVHHMTGIAAANLRRADASEVELCQAICGPCHDRITAKQRAVGQAQARALRKQRLHPAQRHPGER